MPVDAALVRHLDDAVRTGMEATRDSWSSWAEASTAAVVVGCAAELPEVLHEFFPKLFVESRIRPIKLVATLGLFAVIMGVGGELFFTHYVSVAEGQLQTLNATLLNEAQVRIAFTERETAEARRETVNIEKDTQALKTDADTQRAIAGKANQKAAEANERAAQLEVEAASLKRSIILMGDRSLVIDGKTAFLALEKALAPFSQQRVRLMYAAKPGTLDPFDKETYLLAIDIHDAMELSRWRPNYPLVLAMAPPAKGIYIIISADAPAKTEQAAEQLRKALSNVPLDVSVLDRPTPEAFSRIGEFGPQKPGWKGIEELPPIDSETILVFVAPRTPSNEFPKP